MGKTWSIRAYKEGDENQLFELDKAVWGEKAPGKEKWLRGWRWAHVNNPAGGSIIWVAEDNNRIVGQHLLVMLSMKIKGQAARGGEIIDIMTHPEYRHQGISTALGKKLLVEAKEKGIALVIVFPNEQSYPVLMKSGWLDICAFQVMFNPLNLRKLLERYLPGKKSLLKILTLGGSLVVNAFFRTRKTSPASGLTITEVSYFDDRFDEFWSRVSNDYGIIVIRDKNFLNWRYVNVPNAEYTIYVAEKDGEVCGYIVLGLKYSEGLTLGYIYDIIAPVTEEDILKCLISKAVDHFREEKADIVFSKMVLNKIYRKVLLKNGFIPHLRSKSRFVAYITSPKLSQDFIRDPRNWFIQLGDLPEIY